VTEAVPAAAPIDRDPEIDRALAGHAFFADLSEAHRGEVAACARFAGFDAGTALCREGDPADVLHVILAGRLALEYRSAAREPLVVATLGPGEVHGWSWLFPPHRWTCDARVVEPATLLEVDGARLRARCAEDPALGRELMLRFARLFSERLAATRLQLMDLHAHA